MKALHPFYILLVFILSVLSACNSAQYANYAEYDDIYFNSKDKRTVPSVTNQAATNSGSIDNNSIYQNPQATYPDEQKITTNPNAANAAKQYQTDKKGDEYYDPNYITNPASRNQTTTTGGDTYITNNYYNTQRLRPRIGLGYSNTYWGGGMMPMVNYGIGYSSYTGWTTGWSIGFGWGSGWGFYNPYYRPWGYGAGFYDPWYGPGYGMGWYGVPYYAPYYSPWGMNNYANGYYSGYYDATRRNNNYYSNRNNSGGGTPVQIQQGQPRSFSPERGTNEPGNTVTPIGGGNNNNVPVYARPRGSDYNNGGNNPGGRVAQPDNNAAPVQYAMPRGGGNNNVASPDRYQPAATPGDYDYARPRGSNISSPSTYPGGRQTAPAFSQPQQYAQPQPAREYARPRGGNDWGGSSSPSFSSPSGGGFGGGSSPRGGAGSGGGGGNTPQYGRPR